MLCLSVMLALLLTEVHCNKVYDVQRHVIVAWKSRDRLDSVLLKQTGIYAEMLFDLAR